jgi:ABC-type transport system involved in multi-copper enzyme maturation permease subunit
MTAPARVAEVASPSRPSVLGQTLALVVDAYRELNARKLFWITLVLSLLVVVAFAFVGINERGITVFGSEFPGLWNTSIIPAPTFYKFLFVQLAIPFWLGLGASILALISVGGLFPDWLSGGSIDLYLSRPISRARLFLTKYFLGLMFVALQVLVFCLAAFLVIGFRGNSWEWGIFLAVPLVTLFFSYIYCVCVLIGLLTGSTMTAVIVTLLLWGLLWAVNVSDGVLLLFRETSAVRVERQQGIVDQWDQWISHNEKPRETPVDNSAMKFQRDRAAERLAEFKSTADRLAFWHKLIVAVKTPLPKTGETVGLMNRWLVEKEPFMEIAQQQEDRRNARRQSRRDARAGEMGGPSTRQDDADFDPEDPVVSRRVDEKVSARSVAWVLGTSLGFEAVILLICLWIFVRRDF